MPNNVKLPDFLAGYFAYWNDESFPLEQDKLAGYLTAATEVMNGFYKEPVIWAGLGITFSSP